MERGGRGKSSKGGEAAQEVVLRLLSCLKYIFFAALFLTPLTPPIGVVVCCLHDVCNGKESGWEGW